jgi:hypothetical protein
MADVTSALPSSAPGTIVLLTGTGTFANEWLQTGKPNWRVIPATLLAAWGIELLDHISNGAAMALSIMVAIAGVTTTFGGKSIIQELNSVVNAGSVVATGKKA